ncbi:DUF3047 domain-containing protein [Enterovibrio sp. 27052020O]|uniref:DUF3047 domain-containing protein n=1 Tax=Enterovibrio sp. 27052020O TaxID=3241166 RepID=UPI00388FA304
MAQNGYVLALVGSLFSLYANADVELAFLPMSGWEEKRFEGETQYQVIQDDQFDTPVLFAQSAASASGLIREMDIDLVTTPWISWHWKVVQPPNVTNETQKPQDDFALRIGVTVTPGFTMMSSKTIYYVWTPNQTYNNTWGNPFAPNAFKMLSANINKEMGAWQFVSRNVRDDFKRLYGKEYDTLTAVSIMSDSDNSKSEGAAYLSPIRFSPLPKLDVEHP